MLQGCHSSIKATNGTRKTFRERIVVHPQVCSLFLLKALELGIFLGLPIESIGYTFFVVAIVIGLQTYLFYNPHFLSPIVKFYVTVFICDYFFSHCIKGHLTKFTKEPCIVTPTSSGMWPCRWSLFYWPGLEISFSVICACTPAQLR